jgi:hemerythrin-like metal-binding protein
MPTTFTWSDDFLIGVEAIDDQHRYFVSQINSIVNAQKNGYPRDLQVRLLGGLLAYAEFHFMGEETLMAMHRYPQGSRSPDRLGSGLKCI